MIDRISLTIAALVLAGCGGGSEPVAGDQDVADIASPTVNASSSAPTPATGSRGKSGLLGYTSLKPEDCDLVEQNREEAGYSRHRCKGIAGYILETTESDLRQDLIIVASSRSPLNLSAEVAKGAFNALGPAAEWRGEIRGGRPYPKALIVRLNVAQSAEQTKPDISNLVVIEIDESQSCLASVIPPGPDQNARARASADRQRGICL